MIHEHQPDGQEESDMTKRGYTYNICGYLDRERIMKETITATSTDHARSIARLVLRRRGFSPHQVRLEVVKLSGSFLNFL